jgi:O-acetyl-ADP-ribose deacetylase (regulator of RNase III)
MIKYVDGNLFDFIDDHNPVVIAHVCNDQGAWGAGFVLPLAAKYPVTKKAYINWYNATYKPDAPMCSFSEEIYWTSDWCDLGEVQVLRCEPHVFVCNMIAQKLGGDRPLYYNHLCRCMDGLADWMPQFHLSHIICPQFGSGLAGGDWNIIEELINDCWVRVGIGVTVVRYKSEPKKFPHEDINKEKDWTY